MINLKDYKVNGEDLSGNRYINVTEIPATVGKSKEELIKELFQSTLTDIVRTYGCGEDELIKMFGEIPAEELFTYNIFGEYLVKERGVSTYNYDAKERGFVTKYFNVYLNGTPYIRTVLTNYNIYRKIVDRHFPGITEEFTHRSPLTDEEKDFVRMFIEHPDYSLSAVDIPFMTDMTLGDLTNYLKNPSLIDTPKIETDFAFYPDSVYLSLGKRTFANGYEYEDTIRLNPAWLKEMTFDEYLSAPLQQFICDNGHDKAPSIVSEKPIKGSEIEKLYREKLEGLFRYFRFFKK